MIPFAAATVVATLAGGALGLRLAHSLPTLIALTGGRGRGGALRRAPGGVREPRRPAPDRRARRGFVAFFLAERVLVLHHRDDPAQARAHHRVGTLGALGLSAHSFIDGLGIGLAFGLDTATGVLVFVAVISHDFADGLNTVSFVLSQSNDQRQARRWLAIDAGAPLVGAIVGSAITVSEATLGGILAVYAGFFLYMGATDLLPEAHSEHASWRRGGAHLCRLRCRTGDQRPRRRLAARLGSSPCAERTIPSAVSSKRSAHAVDQGARPRPGRGRESG